MAETKKAIELRPRRCRFCTSRFTPSRPQDKDATFCTENCRLSFHKGGTREYQKLMAGLVAELTRNIHETAFQKVVADQMRATREDIDVAVSEAITKRYSPERIAELFVEKSAPAIEAAIQRQIDVIAARKAAEMVEKSEENLNVQAQDAPQGSE